MGAAHLGFLDNGSDSLRVSSEGKYYRHMPVTLLLSTTSTFWIYVLKACLARIEFFVRKNV